MIEFKLAIILMKPKGFPR